MAVFDERFRVTLGGAIPRCNPENGRKSAIYGGCNENNSKFFEFIFEFIFSFLRQILGRCEYRYRIDVSRSALWAATPSTTNACMFSTCMRKCGLFTDRVRQKKPF